MLHEGTKLMTEAQDPVDRLNRCIGKGKPPIVDVHGAT
jgi:hypothetical protein